MKKRILTGLMAVVMAFTVVAPVWGIKAEAKIADNYYNSYVSYYGVETKEEKESLLTIGQQIVNSSPNTMHEKVKYLFAAHSYITSIILLSLIKALLTQGFY